MGSSPIVSTDNFQVTGAQSTRWSAWQCRRRPRPSPNRCRRRSRAWPRRSTTPCVKSARRLGAAVRSAVVEVRFDAGRLTSCQLTDLEALVLAESFSIDAVSTDGDGRDAVDDDPESC